jgi:hypothetical protein
MIWQQQQGMATRFSKRLSDCNRSADHATHVCTLQRLCTVNRLHDSCCCCCSGSSSDAAAESARCQTPAACTAHPKQLMPLLHHSKGFAQPPYQCTSLPLNYFGHAAAEPAACCRARFAHTVWLQLHVVGGHPVRHLPHYCCCCCYRPQLLIYLNAMLPGCHHCTCSNCQTSPSAAAAAAAFYPRQHCCIASPQHTWISWRCVQLRLNERQVQITLRWRWRLCIRVCPQPHASVQQDRRAICVYGSATAEATVCIQRLCCWHHCMRQVLPVNEVPADCMAPYQPECPFTALWEVLVEPAGKGF